MTDFISLMLRCVASFLLGLSMAAAMTFGDVASITAVIGAGSMVFFSKAMLAQAV
jgi:hypothetical protein